MRRVAVIAVSLALTGLVGACSGDSAREAKNRPGSAETVTATPSASATPGAGASAPVTASAAPPTAAGATPTPAVSAPEITALEGTSWAGTDSDGDSYVYRFQPNGRFGYTSPNGTFGSPDDTWSQEGDQVTMKTAGGYATYLGTVGSGTISGTASNQPGHTWTWSAQRQ